MIAETGAAWEKEKAAGAESGDICLTWLPRVDDLRTFFMMNEPVLAYMF